MVDIFTKELGGVEDLLFGQGTVAQTRGLTAVNITKINGDVIPYSGDSATSDLVSVNEKIDNTYQMISVVDTGAANAIAFTPLKIPAALVDKQLWVVRVIAKNTGSTTVTVGTLPAVTAKKSDGAGALINLASGDLDPAQPAIFQSDGTNYILVNPYVVIPATAASVLTGMILPYGGTSAPTGYLLCDGAAVSRTTYSALFTISGTAFGTGDGSTTFNVPDMRDRVPVGKGDMGGTDAGRIVDASSLTLGGSLGTELHTILTAELPSHAHSITLTGTTGTTGSHSHNVSQYTGQNIVNSGQGAPISGHAMYLGTNNNPTDSAGSHSHSISLTGISDSTGSGAAVSIVQPSLILNYIIKT